VSGLGPASSKLPEKFPSNRPYTITYILIEHGTRVELVRLIKMYLNETYNRVRIGKNLSDAFPIQNALEQGEALLLFLFKLSL